MEIEIFLNEHFKPSPRWCVWFYYDDGYIDMTSNPKWNKEDAELYALEEMLEWK